MPKGKYLNETEKAVIDQLKSIDLSNRDIAKSINSNEKVVRNYLAKGKDNGKKNKTKGNTKITNRDKNRAIQLSSTENYFSNDIIRELDLPIKKAQVCKILRDSGRFKYVKKMKKPMWNPEYIVERFNWAKRYVHWTTEWTNVVFSDEKKFNLNGPDGFHFYWHDLRNEKQFNYSRNFGGGSLMVWAAFSMHGKTPIAKVTTRMNSDNYIQLMNDFMDGDFIFVQDNASIHKSKKDYGTV